MRELSKEWFLSTGGVVTVATALFALTVLENSVLPWAPFFVLSALLTTLIPLILGAYSFGRSRLPGWLTAAVIVATPVLMQALGVLWMGVVFPGILGALGFGGDELAGPIYSLGAAFELLFQISAARWATSPETIRTAYLLFVLLWAGLGEELFFRGYMHGVLRQRHGFATAAIVSAAFFGVRHAAQLALVWPGYPWGTALSWVLFAFAFGVVMSYLYEKARTLYPLVAAHYLLNLIPIAATLSGGS